MMRDGMVKGDWVFFYHSNCEPPGIVGIMKIAKESYPDPTAFDPKDPHYDPKSDPDNPRWLLVDVKFVLRFKRIISLAELREHADSLEDFALLRRGNRLSVMPVTKEHWDYIQELL
jgi:predicted RNA-binding protein with PUA-like domain